MPLKLLWAHDGFWRSSAFGMSIHRKKMKDALLTASVEIMLDPADTYDLAVHFIRPDCFKPIPGKKNLLFTACEMEEPAVPLSAAPDVLVVPCEHNRRVFGKHFAGPIEVCPEGIDPALFPFYQRQAPDPDEVFRFLYFGNDFPGTRKGAGFALSAWRAWFKSGRMPQNCQLYFKTTHIPGPELQFSVVFEGEHDFSESFPVTAPEQLGEVMPGMVFDMRDLPVEEIAALQNSAHAFVLPSCGEGWGLTLTEAMATGAPCIWTHYSAPVDYADESTGFPITDFKMIPFWKLGEPAGVGEPVNYGAAAEESAIIARMQEIVQDYPAALARGKAASERMHTSYKWSDAAARFIQICERFA